MKRELVKCLRTVALLAMFSQDSTTVTNIQSCLKSMTVMEPDLILHSILERAVPSLETLVEVCVSPTCYLKPSYLVSLDPKDNRSHQSPRRRCTRDRLARSILCRGETPNPHPTATNTWYRSCMSPFVIVHARHSSSPLERPAKNGIDESCHPLTGANYTSSFARLHSSVKFHST